MPSIPSSRSAAAAPPPSPQAVHRRLVHLTVRHEELCRRLQAGQAQLQAARERFALGNEVKDALDKLSETLFEGTIKILEEKLTFALQEILEQPLRLRAERTFKNNSAAIEFWIERGGEREDILKGQGGSVANILSVGLRLLALTTLAPDRHRRFLVLDEQDCWLRPDLVPRLVRIIALAGRELGFQVLLISHHEIEAFAQYADKIYKFTPGPDSVRVTEWQPKSERVDEA